MPNARGDRATLLMRRQANFATAEAAAPGAFLKVPFYNYGGSPSEDSPPDDLLYGDAFPAPTDRGIQNLGGTLDAPLGLSSIGWHLYALLGAPVTTGSAPNYSHVFEAAAQPALQHYTFGVTHPQVDEHFTQQGMTYTDMSLDARKDGQRARAQFTIAGRKEDAAAATLDATPAEYAADETPIQFRGLVRLSGVEDASITAFTFRLASGVTPDQEAMNGEAFAEAMQDGRWDLTGQITARFRDRTWYDLGVSANPVDLELEYLINLQRSITFRLHNVRIERGGAPVNGGDVISTTFAFRAGRPDPGDTPFRVTLNNGVADYDNP